MYHHFRRLTILLFILAVVLSGCNAFPWISTPDAQTTDQPTLSPQPLIRTTASATAGQPGPTPTDAGLQGVRIRFLHPWTDDSAAAIQALVEQFNRSNSWGIIVEEQAAGSAGLVEREVEKAMTAGVLPEVVAAPSGMLKSWQKTSGRLVDLSAWVGNRQWGWSKAEVEDFYPVFWQEDLAGSRRVGIPAQRTAQVLFYNRSWADELGLTQLPQTLTDFQQQNCKAHAAMIENSDVNLRGLGGWIVNRDALTLLSFFRGWDGEVSAIERGEGIAFPDSPTVEVFYSLKVMARDSCSWVSREPEPFAYFANRQALMYAGPLQDLRLQTQVNKKLGSQDQWAALPFPGKGNPVLVSRGVSFGIFDTSTKENLAAWLFIRWMLQPENQASLVRASTSLPVGKAARAYLGDLEREIPQWKAVVDRMDIVQPEPASTAWLKARPVVEDTLWQLHQAEFKVEEIPVLVKTMNAIIAEVLALKP